MSARAWVAVAVSAALIGCVGCTTKSASPGGAASTIDITETQTHTLPPSSASASVSTSASAFRPAPARTVAALHNPDAPFPAGEKAGTCPYIANQAVADTEGDHVYRTSIITTTTPQGCRFYFYSYPYEAIADIVPRTFATATDAYNAMVATGSAGTSAIGVKGLIPGVDAVLYQTSFYGPDGPRDYACVFAKGNVMVIVHTQQTNVSFNARSLAAQVAKKF